MCTKFKVMARERVGIGVKSLTLGVPVSSVPNLLIKLFATGRGNARDRGFASTPAHVALHFHMLSVAKPANSTVGGLGHS